MLLYGCGVVVVDVLAHLVAGFVQAHVRQVFHLDSSPSRYHHYVMQMIEFCKVLNGVLNLSSNTIKVDAWMDADQIFTSFTIFTII